ncbi:hypothetical protein EBT16_06490 [bacterium]|nr:hypothetical protein [bacterium]
MARRTKWGKQDKVSSYLQKASRARGGKNEFFGDSLVKTARILLITASLCFSLAGFSAEEAALSKSPKRTVSSTSSFRERRGMQVFLFQAGAGMMLDLQDHVRGIAEVAWTPTFHFNSVVSARWTVGVVYRNVFASDVLRVGDISLTLIEKPKFNSPLYGELGGGVQYWTGDASRKFYPEIKAGFGYQFGDGEGFIKSFQLSYARPFNMPLQTHQLMGVFTFGF